MSSEIILHCENLKLSIGGRNPNKATIHLDAIDQYFNDRISESEIDLAIDKVFSGDGGVLGFLKLSLSLSGTFVRENNKAFDLFIKITELHKEKVAKYATSVVEECVRYIRSSQPTAREKEKAGAVIETLVSENCCDSLDRCNLRRDLLQTAQSSKPGIVQSRIFGLIGRLAKDYPDCIENEAVDGVIIRDMYFTTLENAIVNQHNPSIVSLTGAFNGMNDFLVNFGPSEETKEDFASRLYRCIKASAKALDVEVQSFTLQRSALNLLTNHCGLFGKLIFDDFYHWHEELVKKWLHMKSFDNRRPAIFLLHAIHREMAVILMNNEDCDRSREILEFLQNYFKRILELSTSQAFEVRLAIVGFGLMAAPCKRLLEPKDLNELFQLVMQRTESAANSLNPSSKDQLEHFPDYVEALSRIMEQIDQLSGTQLNVLQNIIVSVIRHFHLLSTAHHEMTINTLMRTFHNLSLLGDSIVDDILEKVVNQGVIWTCSHKLPFDAKNDWDTDTDWKDQVTYVSYLPLWNGFLADVETSTYNRSAIVTKIYDQMMRTLFRILDKLNLTVKKRIYRDDVGNDQELFFSDPNYDLEPVRVKDFHIFFNLVSFYQDILRGQSLDSHKQHFLKWINQFIEELISKSFKYPLVSGFVKLLQVVLSIANWVNYFGNDFYEDSLINHNAVYFYLNLSIRKAQQSSGELRIACLKLLFTAPACMLQTLVNDMIPVFQIAFEIGKSNASLFIARMALKAIERYLTSVSRTSNETQEFLRAVLPYFDAYLQGFKNDLVKSVEVARNRTHGSKRTAQKLIKIKENDLMKFQKRIILFLGTLPPEYCQYLLQNSENASLVKCNTTETIRLTLYGDKTNFNPVIYLDTLIPRICEIAKSTTDRQKKMTACEIIQATILYLVGSVNQQGNAHLWPELCKLMLELGCDGDVGVQQMFEPLVMQTVRYLSGRSQMKNKKSEILLKSLLDAISHPSNLAVRDLASRSLRELLSWMYRHLDPDERAGSPFKIVILMQQLKMFNSDMLHERRFGAALAFNNIYRVLREEEPTVSKYWLDLLYDFCLNFRLSEEQIEQHSNCQTDLQQVSSSLDHLLRVLRERKDIFNSHDAERIKPSAFESALLRDAVLWILNQCASPLATYRKKMMEMFIALAPCVDGFNSAANFIRETQSAKSVIDLCENGIATEAFELNELAGIHACLKRLHTTLDCYIWIIENNFMLSWQSVFRRSSIFKVLQYYVNHMMNRNLFANDHEAESSSIIQKDQINAEKSAILILMFNFLNKTMSIGCVPDELWQTQELIWVIETAAFRPQFLECDTKNPEFLRKLPKCLETFITHINRSVPAQFKNDLNHKLVTNTMDIYKSLTDSIKEILNRNSISITETNSVKGIDLIYGLIRTKNVLLDENLKRSIDMSAQEILYQIFEGIKEQNGDALPIAKFPSPSTLKLVNHLLTVCLHKNGIDGKVIDLIMNTSELQLYDSMKTIKHGKHFLTLFKTTIFSFFLTKLDTIVERMVLKMLTQNVPFVLRMLADFTEYAYKTGEHNIVQLKSLTNILASKLPEIRLRAQNADQNGAITMTMIELVKQMAMICPYELTEISKKAPEMEEWLLGLIKTRDLSIETKTQAIFLTPCLVGPSTYEHEAVQETLEHFQKQYFPLYTTELRPGSVERTTFENTFQTILDTMCASKSPVFLRFVINCSAPDVDHIMDHKIVKTLTKFTGSLAPQHQLHCLSTVFEMFRNISLDSDIRLSLMERFLSHLILNSSKETVIQFYATQLSKIEDLLNTSYGLEMSEFKIKKAFTSRSGGFKLLEILSAILTREEICDKESPIFIAKFGAQAKKENSNELLKWMSVKTANTGSEKFQTDNTQYMEWFRKYQCAAFKTLCAIVSNTQTDLKLYTSRIFIEKNWLNMINTTDSRLYRNQTLEVDKKPLIKERLVSIRRLKETVDQTLPNRKYIESQNVFESSLSQDVTKIDLSSSYVRTADEVAHRNQLANYRPKTLMLEKNSINDHEAMATVCAVIDHLFENGITPINDNGTVRNQKIDWIANICDVIANRDKTVHINVRMFLATAIDNCHKWFSNYANVVTPAILKFLIDWIKMNESIDALTVFLVVDLLEWDTMYRINKDSAIEEQNLASSLMEILMDHSYNEQKPVFRRNLELIRNLTERWREFIRVPYQLLLRKLNAGTDKESKKSIGGIHLIGIMLTNELVPWTDETKQDFLDAIERCLMNKYSEVYQPAAQVCGMALNQIIKQNNGNMDEDTKQFIDKLVRRLTGWRASDERRFMYVLYYIDKHYVINEFITIISGFIATSTSDIKKYYLQMFLSRVDMALADDVEVIVIDLLKQSQEHQHQLIGLHIFNKALPKLSVKQIEKILPHITPFQDAKQTESRDVVYEIMIFIREKVAGDAELKRKATEILLNGLNDIDKNLQNTVYKYWSGLDQLSTALNERIPHMLGELYNRDFMKYAIQLLFDIKSQNLTETLLQQDIVDDSKYTEYDINVDWKSQNSTLRVPLFTESQQRQIVTGENDPTQSYLRATQHTLRFDPTLDPSTVHQSNEVFSLQSQSSLLFELNSQVLDRRSRNQANAQTSARAQTRAQTPFGYLRQRILRNTDEANRQRALSAVRRRTHQNEQEMQQQQRKQGQVTLYRRYRFGDFPDFFINSLAFLLPLQVLVQLDAILARNVFVVILNAVYRQVQDKTKFMAELTKVVETILRQPDQCDPMLYSALTEVSLTNSAVLRIDPKIATVIPNENASDMLINTILLLENQLNKSTKTKTSTEAVIWAELANMYYSLSEYDVCASIFSDKIDCDQLTPAIEYESNGDFEMALVAYAQLAGTDILADRIMNQYANDFAYQSLFNCYEVLGKWEDLEANVIEQLTDETGATVHYEQLWTDEWNKKYLLPHYIRSELRTLIYTPTANKTQSFLDNIQCWLRHSERSDLVKKSFSEQLMILNIANKDYLHAKVFSNQYFEGFLSDWSAMSILSEKMRSNKLTDTRRVAEIHKYADLLGENVDDVVIAELTDRWEKTFMNQTDSLQMWEALISYRVFITEHALDKFSQRNAPIVGRLIESLFDMQFELNDMAVQQQNFGLAKTVMRRLKSFRLAYGQNTTKSLIKYDLAEMKRKQIECIRECQKQPDDAKLQSIFEKLLDIWAQTQEFQQKNAKMLNDNPDLDFKVRHQLNEVVEQSNGILMAHQSIGGSDRIFELTGCMDESQSVAKQIESFSRQSCKEAISVLEKCDKNQTQILAQHGSEHGADIGESYYRLSLFCLKQMRAKRVVDKSHVEMERLLIVSVLRGMRLGSKNARLQFPRLLQLPSINSSRLGKIFDQETEKVPLWTFLGWVTQIISRFDFQEPCYLDNLLVRLATTYSSAVIFSFQMALSHYREQKPGAGTREKVQQIVDALHNPVVERFINALSCVSIPEKVLMHHLEIIHHEGMVSFERELKACFDNVFNNKMRGESVKHIEKYKTQFEDLRKMNYKNDRNEIRRKVGELHKTLSDLNILHKEKMSVYCPWLKDYHWCGGDGFIELPGQYTGNAAPNPNRLLKIVKFDADVQIMSSLRKPIRINAICSDGKSYGFLVKYGEDLRQDDRIQQIQQLMSDQMKCDRNCNQQKLSLRTYKVIPLNKVCGIISWIENIDAVASVLRNSNSNWTHKDRDVQTLYETFLEKGNKTVSRNELYHKAVVGYTPEEIAGNLEKLIEKMPENGLRQALYKLSASPECFFALRNNFGKSLATICIVHWLLGIGDRHLGNFLLDKGNGELIGIDFNMAYGAATRNLAIPELVPFRLTTQFVNVLKPLQTSGLLIKCMAHVLRTFRLDSESFLAAVEAIIYEPTLNRQGALNSTSSDSGGENPAKDLGAIENKLAGISPVIPIRDELKSNGHIASKINVVLAYEKIVNGSTTTFRHYLKDKRNLNVEEQVKCLIDIARDPSVLGISYAGFKPWT